MAGRPFLQAAALFLLACVSPLATPALAIAYVDNDQVIVRLRESTFYVGQAKFLGVTPPEVPPPVPAFHVSPVESPSAESQGAASRDRRRGRMQPSWGQLRGQHTMGLAGTSGQDVKPVLMEVAGGKAGVEFDGISAFQQRYSGVGPTYFNSSIDISVPDVGLCVGSGFVVQAVNLALAVYNYNGELVAGVLGLNQFLGLNPLRTVNDGKVGFSDDLTDPSCVYDRDTKRFFLSVAWLTEGPEENSLDRFGQTRKVPGSNDTYGAGTILAVSSESDPTLPWAVFFIPGTNDGLNSHNDLAPPLSYPGPTYLHDYPQIGADAYGVYVTTNQFGLETGNYAYYGSNIYALSKKQLLSGYDSFPITRFAFPWNSSSEVIYSFSMQPAKAAGDSKYDLTSGGTTYFGTLEIPSFSGDTFRGIGLVELSNTQSLAADVPDLRLRLHVIPTQELLFAPAQVPQKDGPIPIGKRLNESNVVGLLDGSVERTWGVAWANGRVWYTFSAAFGAGNFTGVVLALVAPRSATSAATSATAIRLGLRGERRPNSPALELFQLFGVEGQFLIYPSVSINSNGKGIVACALVGPDYYPTAVYTLVNKKGVSSNRIEVVGKGVAPLESFNAYLRAEPGEPADLRFGDYQYVAIDERGNAWGAVEYVGGGGNTTRDNWNTRIFKVDL